MHMADKADFKQSREVYVEQKYAKKEAADIDVGPRKPFGELTVRLDVDASDAITALKAIQREARKATQALRELEAVAALHKGEVVIPEITVKDDADIEKIAKELAEKIRQTREVSKRE
jgi:hypothetical protein